MCPDLPFRTGALGVSIIGSQSPLAPADFEHIVIDTPPGDTDILPSAVKFATTILVPVQPTLQDLNRLRPPRRSSLSSGDSFWEAHHDRTGRRAARG
jgi:hypothetical protein